MISHSLITPLRLMIWCELFLICSLFKLIWNLVKDSMPFSRNLARFASLFCRFKLSFIFVCAKMVRHYCLNLVLKYDFDYQPDIVVNCAAISVPRACETDPASALSINVPTALGNWLLSFEQMNTLLIHLSTDQGNSRLLCYHFYYFSYLVIDILSWLRAPTPTASRYCSLDFPF